MFRTISCLSICTMVLFLVAGNASALEAKEQLVEMARTMAGAQQFSVSIHSAYDVVQASGQKIEFSETRDVQIGRPNNLRVDALQSDGDLSRLFFDGQTLTLFNAAENVYSQTKRSGDVDAAVRYAVGKLGIRVPLARMLVTTFPQEIQKLSSNVDFVERNVLGKVPTDQIAGQTEDVDYQVWIAEDNLPRRVVLTYKNAPGQPQFRADFTNWNLSPISADDTFSFIPPEGAEKIPTLIPTPKSSVTMTSQGGE